MPVPAKRPSIPLEARIHRLRGLRVMLSSDLAELYGVPPKALVQAVKRNLDRFPPDFMFQATRAEFADLKSQSGDGSSFSVEGVTIAGQSRV